MVATKYVADIALLGMVNYRTRYCVECRYVWRCRWHAHRDLFVITARKRMNTLGISKQGYREIKNLGWDGFRFSGSIILLLNGPFTLFFSTTVGGPFSL